MPCIKKVLNSSVVLVEDTPDHEYIILDKGIGYGRKPGQKIETSGQGRIFVPVAKDDRSQLMELLEGIPSVYLEVCHKIVDYAQKEMNTKLNPHIYLSLTDHLNFAVQRIQEGMVLTNRVFWEIKSFYPREFKIGLYGLQVMKDTMEIELPEEEAANIAFHIVNATKEQESQYDAIRASKLMRQIVSIITYSLQIELNQDSIHYSRFISHIQYFCERFFSKKLLDSDEDTMYLYIQKQYPQSLKVAERVREYLVKEYDCSIPNEEIAYLAVHIQRLNTRSS